ncbi:Bcr/CflA family drug resistance efflux transporter [Lamprobacter modestohalophilus]|uniref:Bcr/CflA family efflux transporter n=1 Tax=Lamprobacter modestohalophilus TaxID=1064514 RepID=A0A9X0WDW5_9GAMM|nr:Bcr/CflA family multidrug efflux MFS transporter [Lamprobacter modestohalophilus]MBK1621213.1 Bcr/CflA family drug resistance efflux transporter [Lamprobacter modestohalophilus]
MPYTNRWVLLPVLGLLAALTPFAIDMYLPSIPSIARDLDASIELAQLSVTVYLAVFAAAQLLLGPLSDVHGRRRTIGLGLILFMLGDIACALAPSMSLMLLARAVQAVGGAAVAVTIPALVRDLFERDEYARVMGMIMLVMGFAPLVAPSLGGLIIWYASWHWVFVALLLISLIATLLFFRVVPETLLIEHRHRLHLGDIFSNYGLLLRHRTALGYLLTGSASFSGMMIFIVASPFVYIELHGVSASAFGPLFGINVLAAMLLASVNTTLVRRLGAERLLRIGLALQATAAIALLLLSGMTQPDLWLIAAVSCVYLGMNGLIFGNAMAGFMAFFPSMAGTASAFAGALRFGLGALAGSIVSLLHDGSAVPMLIGMGLCGLLALGIYLLACWQQTAGEHAAVE